MSELLTMQDLANGHLDIKALGEAANGDENTIVTTRTGETYPSAKRAINIMFKNGGLPAKPFATKALMTASALVDGNYAMVTDDAVNNGLYVRSAGAWVKSGYDPVLSATIISEHKLASVLERTTTKYSYEWVEGAAINTDTIGNIVFAPGQDRAYIRVDMQEQNVLHVSGARADVSAWVWVFVDFNGTKSVSSFKGNGSITVPKNLQYAYRTVKVGDLEEQADMKIMLAYNTEGLENAINGVGKEISVPIVEIEGAAANSDPSQIYTITSAGAGRRYIKINVDGYSSIRTTGGVTDQPTWVWVFVDAAGRKISVGRENGNVDTAIPEDAKFALRTTHAPSAATENAGFSVFLRERSEKNSILSRKLKKLEANTLGSSEDVEKLPVNRFYGALPDSAIGQPYLLRAGAFRAYTFFDVQNVKQLLVENSYLGTPWVFIDEKGGDKQVVAHQNGVPTTVPKGARTAVLGLQAGEGTEEPLNFSVRAIYEESIGSRLERVESQLPENYKEKKADLRLIEQMELDLAEGRTLKISDFSGSTQHEQIDNAIAFIKMRGHGILDMESGVWIRNSAILLPDNCWLYLNNATIQLADRVFDNVIRNDGIVPSSNPYNYATELRPNVNIRVFGNGIASSAVNGSAITYSAPHPVSGGVAIPFEGDFFGWRTISIYLVNVKNYKLHDFKMGNAKCWSISQEHGNEDFKIYNIEIQSINVKNGDGIDVRMGCKNGAIYNITGATGDDMVALSAIGGFIGQHPSGNYVYPMQIGSYVDNGFGVDITDVQINNISGRGQHNGVRLLCSGTSKLHRISVNGITDTDSGFAGALGLVSSGYGVVAEMGAIKDITFNNVVSAASGTALKLSGNIKDSIFNKITQLAPAKTLVDDAAVKDNVVITNTSRT